MSVATASTVSHDECLICRATLHDVVLEIRRPDRFELALGIDSDECHRQWLKCDRCDAVSNCRLDGHTQTVLGLGTEYYSVDLGGTPLRQRYEHLMALPESGSDNRFRVKRIASFVDKWFDHRQPRGGRKLLDVGAGLGVFLSAFLEHSPQWDATALEPDSAVAEHLRVIADGRFSVKQDRFEEYGHQGEIHLCTLNKVLEHIRDPVAFLSEAASRLCPDSGLLYVEVPDAACTQLRGATDNALGALHWHLHCPASLARLLDQAGLMTIRTERIAEPSGKLSVFAFACHHEAFAARCGH